MKKIFAWISILAFTIGLVCFLFNLGNYDFMTQMDKIANLNYTNPIADLQALVEKAQNAYTFEGDDIAWYEYIPRFFEWFGIMFTYPVILIKDVATNIISGLRAVLYFLGFN